MKDIMLNYYKHVALPACLALLFGMPLAVSAQDADKGAAPTEQGAPPERGAGGETGSDSAQVDDQTKEKFVEAYVEIKGIQKKYTEKLENVEDKDKARELQKQAQAEMVEVVESNDLSVHEYNKVVGAISSDPELRMEIEKMAQARTK